MKRLLCLLLICLLPCPAFALGQDADIATTITQDGSEAAEGSGDEAAKADEPADEAGDPDASAAFIHVIIELAKEKFDAANGRA